MKKSKDEHLTFEKLVGKHRDVIVSMGCSTAVRELDVPLNPKLVIASFAQSVADLIRVDPAQFDNDALETLLASAVSLQRYACSATSKI